MSKFHYTHNFFYAFQDIQVVGYFFFFYPHFLMHIVLIYDRSKRKEKCIFETLFFWGPCGWLRFIKQKTYYLSELTVGPQLVVLAHGEPRL